MSLMNENYYMQFRENMEYKSTKARTSQLLISQASLIHMHPPDI